MRNKIILVGLLAFIMLLSCNEKPKPASENTQNLLSTEEKEEYLKKGKGIASATFATLSSALGKALEKGGVSEAIEICNMAAFPLVDSLSKLHNATIRRTSLKVRNTKNKATTVELKVLESYAADHKSGKTLQAKVEEVDGMVAFYSPIKVQPLCLSCHGKVGETLKEEDYKLIKTLYPQDQAIGYESQDLRGIWSIKFEK